MSPAEATTRPPPRPQRREQDRLRLGGWGRVVTAILVTLVVGELAARWIGPRIPRVAGTEERVYVKDDQMRGIGSGHTDVVVLGSSDAAGGMVPGTIARHAPQLSGIYNAALAGSELPIVRRWSDRVVLPTLRPRVAVVAMSPLLVLRYPADLPRPNGDAATAYAIAIDQVAPGSLGGVGRTLRNHSALLRWRPWIRDPILAGRGLGRALGITTAPPMGPVENMDFKTERDPRVVRASTRSTGEVLDYRQPSPPVESDPIAAAIFGLGSKLSLDLKPLDALIGELRASGVQPVIALAPIDREVLVGSGVDLARIDEVVVPSIERYARRQHIPIRDDYTSTWDRTDFHDRTHVDAAGAERWSRNVGLWLAGLCRTGDLAPCAHR